MFTLGQLSADCIAEEIQTWPLLPWTDTNLETHMEAIDSVHDEVVTVTYIPSVCIRPLTNLGGKMFGMHRKVDVMNLRMQLFEST